MESISQLSSIVTSTIMIYFAYKEYKIKRKPKIRLNFKKVCAKYADFNLYLENISDINLYDFKLTLRETENLPEVVIRNNAIINQSIPTLTVGQFYETYFMNANKDKKTEILTFDMEYKIKQNGRKIHKETMRFNVDLMNLLSMQIR